MKTYLVVVTPEHIERAMNGDRISIGTVPPGSQVSRFLEDVVLVETPEDQKPSANEQTK